MEEVVATVKSNPTLLLDPVDPEGWTALHHACSEGQLEMVRVMADWKTWWTDLGTIHNGRPH